MYSLVLLNGGSGTRMRADRPKQFLTVNGLPILVYSLVAADAVPELDQIVLNYPEGWREEVEGIVRDYAIRTPVDYVAAGATRQDSVAAALELCRNDDVVLHEAARPLVRSADFSRLIRSPERNVSYMVPIPFTVAPVDPATRAVTGYLDRARLRNVQLPQKFALADLAAAHAFAATQGHGFTEDASMLAAAGIPVHYIDGQDTNIKVTTPTDIHLAVSLLHGETEGD
ncbi:2-C-methyl-D-erythritol 4-phosphate cytidylyltransferase [Blastococcus sp. KM273128]|uniref:IspD/TarI family cytidylyltransferase n=1 Tax=Blastococcus sp. KM273128 TaxID=2570314 RepID=UPI001F019058|nr:2-C-methyl-D-erythritol 4-phosphate cytidylyltransferase [Blastococcus sp. KM273128]MCF6744603.1 2-C-methyl-D-erythritol 4-phosphate cytidylyltransferase [Blastococcus sp. KM273128]